MLIGFAWAPLLLVRKTVPTMPLMIVGSLFFLLGGGMPVAMNTLYAMASDLCQGTDK